MRTVFSSILGVLVLLSILAWRMQPNTDLPGKTTLTWVSDDNPARRTQISLFNDLNPKMHLRLDPNNTGVEKVIVQSIGGVGPDVFDCYDAAQLSAYVKAGIAWDITDELKKAGIDPEQSLWKVVLPAIKYEGRYYGLPTNAGADAIWINKDLFEQAKIPIPKGQLTWEEFIALAQKLTIRDEKGRPKQFGFMSDWGNWAVAVHQMGGRIFTPDGTRCILDSKEAIAGVQFFHDLIYKYRVMPSPIEEATMATAGGWGTGTITQFGGGKGAMALGGRWWLCTLRTYNNLHLDAMEAPFLKYKVYAGYGRASVINRNSPRRQEALNFLLYLASQPYNNLINDQADALAPVVKYCQTDHYMNNPQFPDEKYNGVWRDAIEHGMPREVSPFVNNQLAERIYNKQLDLVRSDQKPVAEALKSAAKRINEEIQKTLKRDPELKAKFDAIMSSKRSEAGKGDSE